LLIAGAAVAAFLWCVRTGQFDDVETPGHRMLHDAPVKDPKSSSPDRD
jgi:cbb3-type cytochrome oxidase maturation protein